MFATYGFSVSSNYYTYGDSFSENIKIKMINCAYAFVIPPAILPNTPGSNTYVVTNPDNTYVIPQFGTGSVSCPLDGIGFDLIIGGTIADIETSVGAIQLDVSSTPSSTSILFNLPA